jgi:hypothetical protein
MGASHSGKANFPQKTITWGNLNFLGYGENPLGKKFVTQI